ncbi:MAG: histidinol-phosphate transaminase [Candidatus Omnitrophica bacterium]|nr:histidinol-phosphate transaminase [Candidatus Omnitrophota bacterium]MDD5487573.1 histidinol-phosphate transaminase [Candidatus Omnitrophota bacterium]
MTLRYRRSLEKLDPYRPGRPVSEIKRELGLDNVVKLASNENSMRPSPAAIKAMTEAIGDVNRYPDGGCYYLRQAVSEKLGVPGDTIIFGNGSDDVILMAIRAFTEPGDEVIMADPTFLMYRISAISEGAEVVAVPAKGLRYDLAGMREAVTEKTRIVFIANPDNPMGCYVTKEELDAFIDSMPQDVLIFLDEAYYEFARGEDYPETIPDVFSRADRNVIVARTFSKVYGLAGLRLGYGVSRPDIIQALNKVRDPFNINSVAQAGALAALGDEAYVEKAVGLVSAEKERMFAELGKMDVDAKPSRTNFILIDTFRDSRQVFEYILKKGVIVREMSGWRLNGYIRVSIGFREENDMFLDMLREALDAVPRDRMKVCAKGQAGGKGEGK